MIHMLGRVKRVCECVCVRVCVAHILKGVSPKPDLNLPSPQLWQGPPSGPVKPGLHFGMHPAACSVLIERTRLVIFSRNSPPPPTMYPISIVELFRPGSNRDCGMSDFWVA